MTKKLLLMLQGLPGSGKTTLAQTMVNCEDGVVRVNKDDIRAELAKTGWKWSPEKEEQVIAQRDRDIIMYLNDPKVKTVISDDTNFSRKHKVRLEQLARENGATFERKFIDFIDTPVEECIRRDSLRQQPVGAKVITDMASRYHIGSVEPSAVVLRKVDNSEKLMSALICDLDGTLCLFGDKRSPYDASKCDEDDLNYPIRKIVEVFYRFMNYQIIYLSGREDKFRPQTEKFFMKFHIPPGPLFMRATGDFRKDWIVKAELFDKHVRDKYNVVFCLDDRNQVVEMWRKMGLTCLQVADGNF